MNWYYRTLLSYAPIFFVVISVLIFSFFSVLNQSVQDQMLETQEAVTDQVMKSLDAHLKAVERTVLKEMMKDGELKTFFGDQAMMTSYDYFLISQSLYDLSSLLPFSNSIYLYNESNGMILTKNGLFHFDEFGDRDYLASHYHRQDQLNWSEPRNYNEFLFEMMDEYVVSMIKNYPLQLERQGAVIVNIHVNALHSFVREFTRHETGGIELYTREMKAMNRNSASAADDSAEALKEAVQSNYTGWHLVFNRKFDHGIALLHNVTDIWMLLGLSVIIAGLIWFTYVTHRNYRPIQTIVGKIQDYSRQKSYGFERKEAGNEFQFIESAINGLVDKTSQYEKDHKEELIMRKNQWFIDLLEGNRVLPEQELKESMKKMNFPAEFRQFSTAVIDIDRFSAFTKTYNQCDQILFKFVISNVLREMAENDRLTIWEKWMEPGQMGVLFFWKEACSESQVKKVIRHLQSWLSANLELSVSAALGGVVDELDEVHRSYDEARGNMNLKPAFSHSNIIGMRDVRPRTEGQIFSHLQTMNMIAQYFRLENTAWKLQFAELFEVFRQNQFSRLDMEHTINYLLYQFNKEMMELSGDIQTMFKEEYMSELESASERSESIDEYYEEMLRILEELEVNLHAIRSKQSNYQIVLEVKDYIDRCYCDPELSLNLIGDKFNINPRYLSKLFKEKFGEKFIDYLLRVRMEQSQKLLAETEYSIQEISEQIGYIHVISFHRAFKKMYGTPPGDYRKKQRSS